MVTSYDPNTSTYNVDALATITTTTVTASGDTVTLWINSVYSEYRRRHIEPIVGIDVKSRPHGIHGGDYHIYVLTLCAGKQCLVFQIHYCVSIPSSLRRFLTDAKLRFVALGCRRTRLSLQHKCNLVLEKVDDVLKTMAVKMKFEVLSAENNLNVEDLARVVLEMEVEKPELPTCKWSDNELSLAEIEYATIDALVPYKAAMRLHYQDLFSRAC